MKTCISCLHMWRPPNVYFPSDGSYMCAHPSVRLPDSLVTGRPAEPHMTCSMRRATPYGTCGTEGKQWEPLPPPAEAQKAFDQLSAHSRDLLAAGCIATNKLGEPISMKPRPWWRRVLRRAFPEWLFP